MADSLLLASPVQQKTPIDFNAINLAPGAADAAAKAAAGPVKQDIPGIGTMTVTPKAIPTAGPKAPEDLTGAYARAGLPPPVKTPEVPLTLPPGWDATTYANFKKANPTLEPTMEDTARMLGIPTYPNPSTAQGNIRDSYNTLLNTITDIESRIKSAATPSSQEAELTTQLNDAKAKLAHFDVESLQASEDLRGQGRGKTLGNINTQDTIIARTRALERLGLATDASILATQLSTAQDARKSAGDLASTEYNLASKRLDIALNVQDKIDQLSKDEQQNARQYLLDTVNFAEGKSFEQLDAQTQAAITHAVANSPITLDMVKTALKSGADKAAANAQGNLRSVAGVGVVQITQDKAGNITGYKVVVPENPGPKPANNAPTFEQYVENQGLPLLLLTPEKTQQLKDEYNSKYGNTTVALGKLTPTNKNDLTQAGLVTSPPAVQSYFLNAPPAFRDTYQRDVASGKTKGAPTLDAMVAAYTTWYNAQNKSGARDWASLLKGAAK